MAPDQRDSVGPAFEIVPTINNNNSLITITNNDNFLATITNNSRGEDSSFGQFQGLIGGNNKCYRNAVLTALLSPAAAMPYFVTWFRQISNRENNRLAPDLVPCRLADISARLFQSGSLPAEEAVQNFWSQTCREPSGISWRARLYLDENDTIDHCADQQDAQEFLTWLMSRMSDEFSSLNTPFPLERYNWFFSSRLVTRVICESCEYPVRQRRQAVESTSFLILNMPPSSHDPTPDGPKLLLGDLLDEAMQDEISDHTCSRCNEESDCTQEKKFQHAPALLTLVISRGGFSNGTLTKNCANVIIPAQLDVSKHLNAHEFGEGSSVTYSLSSMVSHSGATVSSGHYMSYVRGGKFRNEWFRLNDNRVKQVTFSQFNDSEAENMSQANFDNRSTPYILMYERNFAADRIFPGRAANNIDEGENVDAEPSHWTGGEGIVWIQGEEEEKDFPPAMLQVAVEIDDCRIELPARVISNFQWTKRRSVNIDARVRIHKGRRTRARERPNDRDYMEGNLSDMYYFEREQHEARAAGIRKKLRPTPKLWKDFWLPAQRNSDDLSQEDVEKIIEDSSK